MLDEPTNDLDLETLELLEDYLMNYTGTILLVSHDRAFINNIVTSTIVFEGDGVVKEYIGGYDDWVRQYSASLKLSKDKNANKTIPPENGSQAENQVWIQAAERTGGVAANHRVAGNRTG